eukprot:jgi/Chlat1/2259/Chrsp17S08725
MLFMGSKKFPDENEYDRFLNQHGGSSNAFTDCELTCFHFDVNHKFLKPALDRFAQFYVSPLLKLEAMDREVQAVDSEFSQALQSDFCRLQQMQCYFSPEGHPFRKFGWGNRRSLVDIPWEQGVDVRTKLLQLYDGHYHAGRMSLVIVGGEPLDVLESWVRELFGPVRGPGPARLSYKDAGPPIPPQQTLRLHRLESVKDQHALHLNWALPSMFEAYQKKPEDYIAHLVGHEGKGSLLSLLKARGWALELSAGVGESGYDRGTCAFIFGVQIFLTDLGYEKVLDVIDAVFQYLALLRSEGPQEWVFTEIKAIADLRFRFAEEQEADDYAVHLATSIHHYAPEHAILGDYLMDQWDPALVTSCLELLTPENMRAELLSKRFDVNAKGVEREPWFNVPYLSEVLPPSCVASWSKPPSIDPTLAMPPHNHFIPTALEVKPLPEAVESPLEPTMIGPTLLFENSLTKLWYKRDVTFKTPRAGAYIGITSLAAYDSVETAVATEIFLKLLEDELTETSYQACDEDFLRMLLAHVAELYSIVTPVSHRIEIKISGFNDKLPLLTERIFQQVQALQIKDDRFEVIREELVRKFKNAHLKPSKHSGYLRLRLLKEHAWPVEAKLAYTQRCKPADVRAHIPKLLQKVFVEMLVHGNMTEDEAQGLIGVVRKPFDSTELPQEARPVERITNLEPGFTYVYQANVHNEEEDNSVVENYYQVGPDSIQLRAMMDLLEQAISEPCFDQLRTKEQLGYSVDAGVRLTHNVLGLCIKVQSAEYAPAHIDSRIENFIADFRKQLAKLKTVDFEDFREAVIESKLRKPNNLLEETDRHWEQIWEGRYKFNERKLEADAMKKLKKKQLLELYDAFVAAKGAQRRKLSVLVYGKRVVAQRMSQPPSPQTVLIEDIDAFKRQAQFYSPPVVAVST